MSDDEQGKFAELAPDERSTVSRDADGVVTLPKQLWSAFKDHGDGEFLCEVGWVLGAGTAVTSRCVVSKDGDVKASASVLRLFHSQVWFQRLICSCCRRWLLPASPACRKPLDSSRRLLPGY